jgi:transcriptional regulator with XRE-family HTH domain
MANEETNNRMLQRFPEKLQRLRTQRGLSQRQLAKQLNIAKTHMNQLEVGTRKPGIELTYRIVGFFGVSVDMLVRDELDLDRENEGG